MDPSKLSHSFLDCFDTQSFSAISPMIFSLLVKSRYSQLSTLNSPVDFDISP